jgi:homogentisate 1,2-dioxygenase
MSDGNGARQDDPNVARWTREGFAGDSTFLLRPHHTPDFLAVEGPHVPYRLRLQDLALPDREDPAALPAPLLATREGLRISASGRAAPMPFVVMNVEADEIHFVQEGTLELATDHGTLTAGPGDFVCLPRAIAYRVRPLAAPTLSLILEIPDAVELASETLAGLEIARPTPTPLPPGGETVLLVKSLDGVTRYVKPHDPLAVVQLIEGTVPVWRLSLQDLARRAPGGSGPPSPCLVSTSRRELVYDLSARPRDQRPPIHQNADYDEVYLYFAGPGAWGGVDEPGTLAWVPKGIVHHGPREDVAEGYLAWLFDSRGTLRPTPVALAAADLMEPGQYGRHPASQREARTEAAAVARA